MAVAAFRLPRSIDSLARERLRNALGRLPAAHGEPIRFSFRPALSAHRGGLLSGKKRGSEVHAATFLREREVVLESELLRNPRELSRIVVHEIFHFAWLRLGNPRRLSFEQIIRQEMERRVRGELGWSAETRKESLAPGDRRQRTRRWREYACESFCDTAAWLFSGVREHEEFTLASRSRIARAAWFRNAGLGSGISI